MRAADASRARAAASAAPMSACPRVRTRLRRRNAAAATRGCRSRPAPPPDFLENRPMQADDVLTPAAVEFLTDLHRTFDPRRLELLSARRARLERLKHGELPDFLPETAEVRSSDWRVSSTPDEIADRRVEITGPVDRKMVINALNSGARVFMADFEDANSPTWDNCIAGQRNLTDALDRTIELDTGEKQYRLNDEVAVLFVRPRGWHLVERHFVVDGEAMSGSLFDFGLYYLRNHG